MNKRCCCLSVQSVSDHQVDKGEYLERKTFVIASSSRHPTRSCLAYFPTAAVAAAAIADVVVAASVFVVVIVVAAAAVGAVNLGHISETIFDDSWSCSSCLDFRHQKSFDAA